MSTYHLYLDESGHLKFNTKSSRHYVFTVAWTYDPLELGNSISTLRFALLREGRDLPRFHATDDHPKTRQAVIDTIVRHRRWRFASIVIEKNKVHPSLYEPQRFYPIFAGAVLRFVLRRRRVHGTDRVLIYVGNYPIEKRREAIHKAIKSSMARALPSTPFHLYCHPAHSNSWLQVADYCCWAVFKKWEFKDSSAYSVLSQYLCIPEYNILAKHKTVYY